MARGERRTLRIVAEQADGCNLPVRPAEAASAGSRCCARHCAEVGRDPDEVEITVLDLPVLGTDREDTAVRVERLRGRTPAPAFAARHPCRASRPTTPVATASWPSSGVGTVFLALPDLGDADDLTAPPLAPS